MDISNVSNTALLQALVAGQAAPGSSLASTQGSPDLQKQSLLASSDAALFSSLAGSGSVLPDVSGLTAAAQAYSLYTNPALVQQLASGASSPGVAAGSGSARTAAVASPVPYAFNPFDEASWWASPSPLGTTVDSTA